VRLSDPYDMTTPTRLSRRSDSCHNHSKIEARPRSTSVFHPGFSPRFSLELPRAPDVASVRPAPADSADPFAGRTSRVAGPAMARLVGGSWGMTMGCLLLVLVGCGAGRSMERDPDARPAASVPSSAPAVASEGPAAPPSVPRLRTYDWLNPVPSSCADVSFDPPDGGSTGRLLAEDGGAATRDDAGTASSPWTDGVARVVAAMRSRFSVCYSTHLDGDGRSASGRVHLHLSVDCEGRIAKMTAEASGVDQRMVECLFAAVGNDRFDPPPSGKSFVNVPINFVRQTEKPEAATPAPDVD